MKKTVFMLVAAAALSGCMSTGRYDWGSYERSLYRYYKAPATQEEFIESLSESVSEAEASGKIPPGLYAEYGFLLLKAGKDSEARRYFEKEQEKWPESRIFMQALLKDAGTKNKTSGE